MARLGYKINKHLFSANELELIDSMGVYKAFHINKPNKIYIGSTISKKRRAGWRGGFYTRWCMHISRLRTGKHESKEFQNIVNVHGIQGVRFGIIEVTSESQAREREKYWIDKLQPHYNKISRKVYQFDMSGKFIERHNSVMEAGEKLKIDYTSISSNCSGRRPSAGGFLWSFSMKVKVPVKRCIRKFSLDGKFLAEYENLEQIKKELNIVSSTSVRSVLKGKQRQAYGFKWIEAHPKEAKERGWSESRLATIKQKI